MKSVFQETFTYSAVSGCAFVVDFMILFVLVHYFSWGYLAAVTTSFLMGLLLGYALSVTLVFKYRRLKDRRLEFSTFAGIGVAGAGINAATISFGVRQLGLHYLIAKCGAAALTFLWNFLARRQFLFAPRRGRADHSA